MTIVAFVSTYATIKLGNKIKRKVINQSMTYAYTNMTFTFIISKTKKNKLREREREREREKLTLTILTRKVANVKTMSSTSSKKKLVIIS